MSVQKKTTSPLADLTRHMPRTAFETTSCSPCTRSNASSLPPRFPSRKAPQSTSCSTTPSPRTLLGLPLALDPAPRLRHSSTRLRRQLRRRTSTRYTTSRTPSDSSDRPRMQRLPSATPSRDPPHCTSYPTPPPDDSAPWAPPTLLFLPIPMTLL